MRMDRLKEKWVGPHRVEAGGVLGRVVIKQDVFALYRSQIRTGRDTTISGCRATCSRAQPPTHSAPATRRFILQAAGWATEARGGW